MRAPVLAVVGRPNVGKSTLFNRLAGRRIAIVEDMPGVTRDRLYAQCRTIIDAADVLFTIIDTGGFEPTPSSELFALVREQTRLAIEEADVIIHVVDTQLGLHPDDITVARMLRKSGRQVLVAANKVDHVKHEALIGELFQLGVDRVLPVSAAHGRGIDELLETCFAALPEALQEGARAAAVEDDENAPLDDETLERALDDAESELDALEGDGEGKRTDDDDVDVDDEEAAPEKPTSRLLRAVPEVLRIAVVGKPNAGKSSFVNKLLGEERHLVSDMPGTTMDAVDSFVEYGGARFRVIDTAGIRRKRSISARVEQYAVVAALRGMDRADVVLHLIDAAAGLTEQDKRIASFVEDKGKAVILVVNKWDLAKDKELDADSYAAQLRDAMPFVDHAPIRFVSAKTGKRVHDVLSTATDLAKRHFQRISTSQVNKVLQEAVTVHQPPMNRGKRVRLYFATQVKTAPPTFVIATNDVEGVHFSYRRFLINQLREAFDFGGAPVRLIFRRRDGDRLKNLSPAQKFNRKLKRDEQLTSTESRKPAKGGAAAAPPPKQAPAKKGPAKKAPTKKAAPKKAPPKKPVTKSSPARAASKKSPPAAAAKRTRAAGR
jgi:GTP-binding protein